MSDADTCFDEGMKHIGLSRHADYHSEYVGDLESAVACFERALALNADHAAAWSEKGTALAILGRHEEAAAALAEAIRLRPGVRGTLARKRGFVESPWTVRGGGCCLRYHAAAAARRRRRDVPPRGIARSTEARLRMRWLPGMRSLAWATCETMNFHGRTVRTLTARLPAVSRRRSRGRGVVARLRPAR
jgi:hypothetical protein